MQAAIPFPSISPEIFSVTLFGVEFALRWYAMAYIVGIGVGWWIARRAVQNAGLWPAGKPPIDKAALEDLVTYIILGVIVGGRLGYVFFYQPAYYLSDPLEIPAIWQGGMAFHGGFLGVGAALWLFSRKHGAPLGQVCDILAVATPPALLLGRSANFINAELWGRPTDLPWGVIFPGEAAQACGQVAGLCARHPSQLYEALLEGLILGLVLLWLAFRRQAFFRTGLLTGVFFAGYGAARFAVEFVRQPDAQFVTDGNPLGLAWHVGGYGLTMGQLLSLPMTLVGLWLIARARRA
ncbi:prolipoprotein diacylglyceryl transferase [Pseudaestuariivita sp.]|uniref:prolipoprotein diacylglyceryl transferase n=1 Tax=Pseudaestuariivita sp. TaxID=2211669 RepID=UPI004059E110